MDKNEKNRDYEMIEELCSQLIKTLECEEEIYLDLVKKESMKKDAIMDRNTDQLMQLTRDQEKVLADIDKNEKVRSELVSRIADAMKLPEENETVSSLVSNPSIQGKTKEMLLHHSYALREVMITLKNITSVNQEILEDNHNMFKALIEDLTETKVTGYGPGESKSPGKKSLFVNING